MQSRGQGADRRGESSMRMCAETFDVSPLLFCRCVRKGQGLKRALGLRHTGLSPLRGADKSKQMSNN